MRILEALGCCPPSITTRLGLGALPELLEEGAQQLPTAPLPPWFKWTFGLLALAYGVYQYLPTQNQTWEQDLKEAEDEAARLRDEALQADVLRWNKGYFDTPPPCGWIFAPGLIFIRFIALWLEEIAEATVRSGLSPRNFYEQNAKGLLKEAWHEMRTEWTSANPSQNLVGITATRIADLLSKLYGGSSATITILIVCDILGSIARFVLFSFTLQDENPYRQGIWNVFVDAGQHALIRLCKDLRNCASVLKKGSFSALADTFASFCLKLCESMEEFFLWIKQNVGNTNRRQLSEDKLIEIVHKHFPPGQELSRMDSMWMSLLSVLKSFELP